MLKKYSLVVFLDIFESRKTTWEAFLKIQESTLIIYVLTIHRGANVNSLTHFLTLRTSWNLYFEKLVKTVDVE